MSSGGVSAAITVIAEILVRALSDDEINILSAMLVQLGDTLATLMAVKEAREGNQVEIETKSESGKGL
ncbi:MAG: DUF6774 domain-containing protein [Eubacteriales bacterium]